MSQKSGDTKVSNGHDRKLKRQWSSVQYNHTGYIQSIYKVEHHARQQLYIDKLKPQTVIHQTDV